LREMLLPFCFSFVGLSLLMLLGSILPLLETLLRSGITASELATLVLLILPTFWVFVLPMATLLGILLGFLRLSRDSEMVALLASGIGPGGLLRPVAAAAVLFWALSLLVSAYVLPRAKMASRDFVRELTERTLARGIPQGIFFTPISGLTIHVKQSLEEGRRLRGIFVRDARRKDLPGTILASDGELLTLDQGTQVALALKNGTMNRIGEEYTGADTLDFKTYFLRLNIAGEAREPSRGEMDLATVLAMANDPEKSSKRRTSFLTEFHKRLALPAGTLILGILAAPLGIFFGRTGPSGGVAIGLVAFLSYYLSTAFVANLAEAGALPAGPAIWTPNCVFACLTGGLLWLLARRGPMGG